MEELDNLHTPLLLLGKLNVVGSNGRVCSSGEGERKPVENCKSSENRQLGRWRIC